MCLVAPAGTTAALPPLAAAAAMRINPNGDGTLPPPCVIPSRPTRSYAAIMPAIPNAAAGRKPLRPLASGIASARQAVTSSRRRRPRQQLAQPEPRNPLGLWDRPEDDGHRSEDQRHQQPEQRVRQPNEQAKAVVDHGQPDQRQQRPARAGIRKRE